MEKNRSVRRVFIDTSVFIRFLTEDDARKAAETEALLERVSAGNIRPYTSNIVIFEMVFVLGRHYKFTKAKVLDSLGKLLALRNLTLIEKSNTTKALHLWHEHGIKYGDCLIATQVPRGVALITYDADFKKIGDLDVYEPSGF